MILANSDRSILNIVRFVVFLIVLGSGCGGKYELEKRNQGIVMKIVEIVRSETSHKHGTFSLVKINKKIFILSTMVLYDFFAYIKS